MIKTISIFTFKCSLKNISLVIICNRIIAGTGMGGTRTLTYDEIINGAYRLEISETIVKDHDLTTTYLPWYPDCCRIAALQNNAGGSWSIQSIILLEDGNRSPLIDLPILYQVPQRYQVMPLIY